MMVIPHNLWTAKEAMQATGGVSADDWIASGVSINTRSLNPGDLFIALAGPKLDGHDFVADAFAMGAVAAVVSHRPENLPEDASLLVVTDTQKALEDLGRAARARAKNARVIAVTGSVGKTGVKEALAHVLAGSGKTSASQGSLNNHWGLPLSLARMAAGTRYAVMETGMNHPGELSELSKMARPDVCVITTIQPAHTEFFNSLDEIADAKAEIFIHAEPGATAVLNRDIEQFSRLADAAGRAGIEKTITFGSNEAADVRLASFEADHTGSDVAAIINGQRLEYRIGASGRHWVMNSLCVLAAVIAAGADVAAAAGRLAGFGAPPGRGQRFSVSLAKGNFTLIDESYNASPASMKAALDVLSAQPVAPGGRRIAVLGDMLELGGETVPAHRQLGADVAGAGIDTVFAVGSAMQHMWDNLGDAARGGIFPSSTDAANAVQGFVREGDVVMVKGSAGVRMVEVVSALKGAGKKGASNAV